MKNMKRALALLLVLLLMLPLTPGAAAAERTEKGFTYTIENGEATVLSGPAQEEIVIPDTLGGCPVTALADSAFSGICEVTTTVRIPETVRTLGSACFFGSNSIFHVNLPSGLEYIGDDCFGGSSVSFEEVRLNLKYLGRAAFENVSVRKLVLGEGLTQIPYRAFCFSGLEEVQLPNSLRTIEDSAFFRNSIQKLEIPEGVVKICENAFYGNGIEEITLPSTLEVLGESCLAFNRFSQIGLPDGLKIMGFGVFGGCENLKKLTVPASVILCDYSMSSSIQEVTGAVDSAAAVECQIKNIPFRDQATGQLLPEPHTTTLDGVVFRVLVDRAIVSGYNENALPAKVVLPDTVEGKPVTELGENAFSEAPVEQVIVPEGVTRIGYDAFSNCTNLYYVQLPETVQYLKDHAFFQTPSLEVLYVPASVEGFIPFFDQFDPETMVGQTDLGLEAMILLSANSAMEEYAVQHNLVYLAVEEGRRYYQYGSGIYSTADGETLRVDKLRPHFYDEVLRIPDTLAGLPVTEIAPLALCGDWRYSLWLGSHVTAIDQNAFFLNSPGEIFIPDQVTYIHDRAFPYDAQPTICGYSGSYAERYAKDHGYVFKIVREMPFTDVKEGTWYYDQVLYAYRNGLMQGVSETKFQPEGTTSRAMLVQVLFNFAGDPDFAEDYGFTDIPQTAWYAQAVNWAACNGIVNGVSVERFAPGAPVTREQAAAILYRFASKAGLDVSARADLKAYSDRNKISNYAQDPMAWAVGAGIIKGMSATTLEPQGQSTRAQIATMLMRFVTWTENQA